MGGAAKSATKLITGPIGGIVQPALGATKLLTDTATDAITPDMPKAPAPPPPPERTDTSTRQIAEEERKRDLLRARQGPRSTILTTPLGVTGEAQTRRSSVLG